MATARGSDLTAGGITRNAMERFGAPVSLVESVLVSTAIIHDDDGEVRADESEPVWDTCEAVEDPDGRVTIACVHRHEWQARMTSAEVAS